MLLDAGRTRVLADEVGRVRRCIASAAAPASTSARSTRAPADTRTAPSIPGPIGAILTPQLIGVEKAPTLPYASSALRRLLRGLPRQDRHPDGAAASAREGRRAEGVAPPKRLAMRAAGWLFRGRRRFEAAQRAAWLGVPLAKRLPGPLAAWTKTRDLGPVPSEASASGGVRR